MAKKSRKKVYFCKKKKKHKEKYDIINYFSHENYNKKVEFLQMQDTRITDDIKFYIIINFQNKSEDE